MSTHAISPLFSYMSNQIESLIESVEFDESVFVLEGLRTALVTACDPLNVGRNSGGEFQRVMLVLQTMDSILSSGAIPQRGSDNDKIRRLCDVSMLPTEL